MIFILATAITEMWQNIVEWHLDDDQTCRRQFRTACSALPYRRPDR